MNIWRKFKALIPDDPLLIAEIIEVDTSLGQSRVTTLDGGVMWVRGTTVTLGGWAFVRGGVIEGKAPDLGTPVDLEV